MNSKEAEVAKLEERVRELDQELLEAVRGWASTQADFAYGFLKGEAKLTVTKQSRITESIAAKIPALREKTESIAESARAALTSWADAIDAARAIETASDPRATYREVTAAAMSYFGDTFRAAGYTPDDRPRSRDWDVQQPWKFYDPRTGAARSEHAAHDGTADRPLKELLRKRSEARTALTKLRAEISTSRAADLWEE